MLSMMIAAAGKEVGKEEGANAETSLFFFSIFFFFLFLFPFQPIQTLTPFSLSLFLFLFLLLSFFPSSSWTPMSMKWMSGLPDITIVDKDVMHPVSQIPVHLPHINNTCSSPDSTCTLLTASVTENIYGPHHDGDNPTYPLAAVEVGDLCFLFYVVVFGNLCLELCVCFFLQSFLFLFLFFLYFTDENQA